MQKTPEQKAKHAAYMRKWSAANPDKVRSNSAKTKARHGAKYAAKRAAKKKTPKGWVEQVLVQVKYRSKTEGTAYYLSPSDIEAPELCPVTLRSIKYGAPMNDRAGPSLDRITPSLGYVKGNVRVLSRWANTMKQDCTDPAVFERIAAYVRGEI